MLTIKNVTKRFYDKSGTVTILDDVTFDLPSTGFIALCGKSGCGKTTLLKMIAGDINDFEGKILYDGEDVLNYSFSKRDNFYSNNIFYLKYTDNFFGKLTVKESISFYLNKKEQSMMYDYINKFSLNSLLNKKISNISSGELQKVSLCFALAKRAKITILDEPICNIDAKSIYEFLDEIKKLSKEVLVLYVSHFERDITDYYDEKVRIYNGKITHDIVRKNNYEQLKITNNIQNKFNFINSLKCEKIKPQKLYIIFRLIIIIFLMMQIFVTSFTKIKNSDIYIYSLDKMSLNIIDDDNDYNYDCIKKHKLYTLDKKYSFIPHYLTSDERSIHIDYVGIADEYYFNGFNSQLEENEIIISDLLAEYLKLTIGDTIRSSNYILNSSPVTDTYTVKWIYKTDFYSDLGNPNSDNINQYDYKYKIAFISQKKFDYFEDLCTNGSLGLPLDSDKTISKWKPEFDNNTSSPKPNLNDDEFYAGIAYLYNLGYDIDFAFDGIGETVEVVFAYNGKKITKNLKYMGIIDTYNNRLAVSDNVFNEIVEEFSYADIFQNYKYFNTINFKEHDFENFCKEYLTWENAISFANKSVINQNFAKKSTSSAIIKNNIIYLYFFGFIFLLVSVINIIKIEKYSFVMLKEKNYNVKNAIFTNNMIKIFVWLFISLTLCFLNLYAKELLIKILYK